jgi:15-cis-phytoene synthase
MNLELAFRHCEHVTRSRATNFYYGIRLLPGPKRRALCSIYAFARRVDDIADGPLPDSEKLLRLQAVRGSLDRLSPGSADPVLSALGHACTAFAIQREGFTDLIDGVEMDVRGATYDTFSDLETYCRRVAGSIGRLSVGVFGATDPSAMVLADDLGVAMQITNVLRDVREDLSRGRVYLPREDLERFGCGPDLAGSPSEATGSLIEFEAGRARAWFDRGLGLISMLDGRSASCVIAMTGIYLRLLGQIEEQPDRVLGERLSLAPWEKAWVAARSLSMVAVASSRGVAVRPPYGSARGGGNGSAGRRRRVGSGTEVGR